MKRFDQVIREANRLIDKRRKTLKRINQQPMAEDTQELNRLQLQIDILIWVTEVNNQPGQGD